MEAERLWDVWIGEAELSQRSLTVLFRAGLHTFGDVENLKASDLYRIPRLGRGTYRDIRTAMNKLREEWQSGRRMQEYHQKAPSRAQLIDLRVGEFIQDNLTGYSRSFKLVRDTSFDDAIMRWTAKFGNGQILKVTCEMTHG